MRREKTSCLLRGKILKSLANEKIQKFRIQHRKLLQSIQKKKNMRKGRIPLFIATRNGIIEIVSEIIETHPHATEQLNEEGQSIFDVAVMHRQEEIVRLVKQQKIPLARLHRVIDHNRNTLLHHVADMKYYSGGTKPGPALKLQEELRWFDRVSKATIYGNYEAVRLLVERCPVLLFIPNNSGETPLFTAAGFGEAEIVEFLFRSEPEQCMNDKRNLLEIHRQRGDGLSILSAAIIGQHFETALLLLEVDGSLHSVEDRKGRTALQYLADMPSAFKSGYSMGIFETLFHCCLPVIRHHEVKQTRGQARQGVIKDLERGLEVIKLERNQRGGLLNCLKAPKAMRGDWKNIIHHYQDRSLDLFLPVTLSADTALHIAVYSKQAQPLQDLLEIVNDMENFILYMEAPPENDQSRSNEQMKFLMRKNKFGNTALHEATICGSYEAVRLLVGRCPDLLTEKNNYGETPLFTAAGFAEAEIVEFLLRSKPEQCVNDECRVLDIHRKRQDGLPILSSAIKGQHFETALMLLHLDGSLHDLKDNDGVDALQLLAHMPTAFGSGFPMGICERLIYCCLPVKRHHNLKSQLETWFKERKKQGDLESGQGRESEAQESGLEWNQRGGILKYLKVPKGCWLGRFWNQKTKHVFAFELAKILIKKDESLNKVSETDEKQGLGGKENGKGENKCTKIIIKGKDTAGSSETRKEHIPLFIATINGIEEIVWEIIDQYPHAIEKLNEEGQSILDVAVMHRQKKIFRLVKQQKVPLARLHRVIDNKGNTLLHHVADMKHYSGGTKPGPALQLQEELQWFEF
uniref:PGG domain-containing protein n=1 Tax=Salix viminalis TaxID=40686 RepID=A0A6N2NAP5_SALVM